MVLRTLDMLGPLHGYGTTPRVEQISGDLLSVNQGALYPVLLKMKQDCQQTAMIVGRFFAAIAEAFQ